MSLLAQPLNVVILRELATKPKSLAGLRRSGGSPPTTTMRRHLQALTRGRALEPRGKDGSGAVVFGLTPVGHGLLRVASVLEGWLAASPAAKLDLGSDDAALATTALVNGWSVGIVRAIAAAPLSLGELGRIIRSASSPSPDRCLRTMRLAGLVEPAPGTEPTLRFQPTRWLRQAIAPLAAAARWERQNTLEEARPISRLDVEAAFLLTMPLVRLPAQLDGTCRLAVEVQAHAGKHAGVLVTIKRGRIASCVTSIRGHAENWVSGSPPSWLYAVIDGESEGLEVGGNDRLADILLTGLHLALFGSGSGDC